MKPLKSNVIQPVCAVMSTVASTVKEELYPAFQLPREILETLKFKFELTVYKLNNDFSAVFIIDTEEGKVIDVESLIFRKEELRDFYSFIKFPFTFLSNPEVNILWFTTHCEITTQEFRDTIQTWKLSCTPTNDSSS